MGLRCKLLKSFILHKATISIKRWIVEGRVEALGNIIIHKSFKLVQSVRYIQKFLKNRKNNMMTTIRYIIEYYLRELSKNKDQFMIDMKIKKYDTFMEVLTIFNMDHVEKIIYNYMAV
jgi:hypothetical protein